MDNPEADWPTWEKAWQEALYGPAGFYRRSEGPAAHFRTAAHAAPEQLARAVAVLAAEHRCAAVIDVGAGRGELLRALTGHGLRLHGVDVVPRPELDPEIGWSQGIPSIPDSAFDGALVIGWELLDVVPGPVLERDEDGTLRQVQVHPPTGRERPGPAASPEQLAWQQEWWPAAEAGDRVEVGAPRDALWSRLLARAQAGGARAAIAVDYAHTAQTRPAAGSLTGFRAGRAVPPRPDGSMDVTAHVAIDAVAAAAERLGPTTLTTQREQLRGRGVTDRNLLDAGGLGGFAWLCTRLNTQLS